MGYIMYNSPHQFLLLREMCACRFGEVSNHDTQLPLARQAPNSVREMLSNITTYFLRTFPILKKLKVGL
jgi:hypothetical protein